MNKLWLLGLWLLCCNVFAQTNLTKVIQLEYVPADKIIQLIQPLLVSGEKISGSGQTLVVNVTADTLTQIRALLHKLDVPPVTLTVSVYQGDVNWLASQNSNDVVYSTRPRQQMERGQSVTVVNGESAMVSTGSSVPVINSVGFGWNTGVGYEQQPVQNSLLVSPLLQGAQVKISVKKVREQQNTASWQQFDDQQLDTTIMAPLNKWVQLGSAEGAQFQQDSNTVSYSAGRAFQNNSTLYIKVSRTNSMPVGPAK